MLLVKSVQLRRLGPDSRVKGVFCNISVKSLLDPEFFPELVEFMEENTGLSESLLRGEPAGILALNAGELGALDTLALSVTASRSTTSPIWMWISPAARPLLPLRQDRRHDLPARLEGEGLALHRRRDEARPRRFRPQTDHREGRGRGAVAKLLDYGVELAQGYLFGGPKPMSPALFASLRARMPLSRPAPGRPAPV